MLIDKVKVGDIVYVVDWSYTVSIDKTDRMYLGYNAFGDEPHIVVAKGKFPGDGNSKRSLKYNNIHLKNIKSGDEFYIQSRFIRKMKKEPNAKSRKNSIR